MRLRCSGAMPAPESETTASMWPLTSVATRKRPPPGMASLALKRRLRKTCCSFAGVAVDGRQRLNELTRRQKLGSFELVLKQGKRVADDLVEVGLAELGRRGAGEIQQAIGDFRSAEALLGDLFEHWPEARIGAQLL